MTSLRKSIIPKSDQLNADDFISGPMTIEITAVKEVSGDSPIAISFKGDNGKPYKPCKSMRRVLVMLWSDDGNTYVGKRLTLYRDPTVKFGGEMVGGIRISHMSDITEKKTMALTATRGSRKPYTVFPLGDAPAQEDPLAEFNALKQEGDEAAERGTTVLEAFWLRLKPRPQLQKSLVPYLDGWKKRAKEIDDSGVNNFSAG